MSWLHRTVKKSIQVDTVMAREWESFTDMRAIWKDQVLAESNDTLVVEGNHYFPAESINKDHFTPCEKSSFCPWKGTASYYDVVVAGETNEGAAWYYPSAKEKAKDIEGMVAFWRGVQICE
jgi:uncharacterized protein (DUF427 family)